MRKTLFKLHSYLSLVALIPIVIASATGSILVFKAEIDRWLMPQAAALPYSESEKAHLDRKNHNILQSTIESTFPMYIIGSWEIFNDGIEADRIYLIEKGTDDWHKIYFDPFANQVLSEPVSLTSSLTDWLLNLHYTFMLNGIENDDSQWGTLIGLLAAIILTFLSISGLIIHRRFWKYFFRLRIKKSIRVISGDLHRLIGTWSAPVILILGITGIYFNAIEYYHEVFEHGTEGHYQPINRLYDKKINFQSILDDSQDQLEVFTPTYLVYPYEPEMGITVFGFQPNLNPFSSSYLSTVTYDRATGELKSAVDGRKANVSTQVFDSFRQLHFGSFAGLTSKVIWSLLGLSPVFLALTGITIWIKRKSR